MGRGLTRLRKGNHLIKHNGFTIECQQSGDGSALLFLPGSYSTAAAWRPIQRLLEPRWRLVTTSLLGYGESTDSRSLDDYGVQHQVELVEALCRHIGQPVHLVGHSFGGTVALAAALAAIVPVASLSLFEGNPIDILRGRDGGALYQETLRMSRAFEAAVQGGEPDAPGRIIDFWGGAGAYAALPDAVKAYCRQTAAVNVLDWRTAFEFKVTMTDCASLQLPVLLVRGEHANAAMTGITAALQGCLPNVAPHVVEGAGHFLVSSHAPACAALLSRFLDGVIQDEAPARTSASASNPGCMDQPFSREPGV